VHATHVADRRDQDVQQDGRERTSRRHSGVALENFFVVEVHSPDRKYNIEELRSLERGGRARGKRKMENSKLHKSLNLKSENRNLRSDCPIRDLCFRV